HAPRPPRLPRLRRALAPAGRPAAVPAGPRRPDRHPLPGPRPPAARLRGPRLPAGGVSPRRAGRTRGALPADVPGADRGPGGSRLRRGARGPFRPGGGGAPVRVVKAVHGLQELRPDPDFEIGLAACLRTEYGPDGLAELYARFADGEGKLDRVLRRVLWRALTRRFGHG